MGLLKHIRNKYWKPTFLYKVYKTLKFTPKKFYSQWGEDNLIDHFLLMPELSKKNGFYLDIGCNDPRDGNNFTRLYRMGWRGANLDIMPFNIKLHELFRPKDKNMLLGASSQEGELDAYVFSNSFALNTLDKEFADKWSKILDHKYTIQKVPVKRLDDVINEFLPNQKIDIISIDVEGHEDEVLAGFTLNKHLPTLVLCEIHGHDIEAIIQTKTYTYFKDHGYRMVSRCGGTCFFVPDNFNCGF